MAGERKQTRNSLSLSVKQQILREIEVEKKKKTDVAQKHNIPQSSLSTIIKNSEKIHQQALHAGESSRKRARGSTYADVDEALLQWFKQARSAALPVNGPLLSEKAKTLALEFGLKDFTGSGGWIERWKARHGIKLRNICGESADVNRETMTNWLTDVMPNIISNYACKDIFNADETGLFWRLLPDKTLHFKGETCTGGKASKERITILLCCNMDGSEKMQPLVIGKAKQPRCFRGIKHLPVQYEANQKAWMTGLLFESWVRHIDKKMAGQHRQIILLLDNCGAHPPDMQGLTNTRIAFLPPNTTSMLQPCDQGIIRNFKMIYRTRLMRKYLTAYDAGTALTINLKQAASHRFIERGHKGERVGKGRKRTVKTFANPRTAGEMSPTQASGDWSAMGAHLLHGREAVRTLKQVHSHQNDRSLFSEAPGTSAIVEHRQNMQSVMVWAGICQWQDPTPPPPPRFPGLGVKINQEVYRRDILEAVLIPWFQQHFNDAYSTFQQDSAPAHKAQDWCRAPFPDFITSAEWPSYSLDLKPTDYRV
ncbi:TIGD4 [Cordylochernes scorpioides]|uniref:TIGD4 n=1 Tax=Cordylochernes scorpioides TaxID=51811 RepID=A0ABY6LYH8_9ARAC|nr:TIGD4 [Cordylochernes scorpioides]